MPRSVNIARMRDRITFEEATKTPDGIGGFTLAWATAFSTWADVQEVRGNREMRFGQIAYNIPYEITLRFRNGDTSEPLNKYRILYNGEYLTIHSIIDKHESTIKILAYSTTR